MNLKAILPILMTSVLAHAGPPTKDCCPPSPTTGPKAAACCREEPSAPYSKDSIYQLDARFTDDSGRTFAFGALRGSDVVLDMFFATCGNACPITVSNMLAVESRLSPQQRSKTLFVLVSFDVARDTPEALAIYRSQRRLDGRWILLHGDGESVRELAALLGVKYKQAADGSFAHSNLLTVLNAKGEIAHQSQGLQGTMEETLASLAATN